MICHPLSTPYQKKRLFIGSYFEQNAGEISHAIDLRPLIIRLQARSESGSSRLFSGLWISKLNLAQQEQEKTEQLC